MVGIIGYGTQIPRYRIKVEEIAKVWGADPVALKRGLNLNEKSVPAPDEDCATLSVNAARNALRRAGITPSEIGAVYVGSESHPYAVKPTGTIVSEALGACPYVHTADLEFAWYKADQSNTPLRSVLILPRVLLAMPWNTRRVPGQPPTLWEKKRLLQN